MRYVYSILPSLKGTVLQDFKAFLWKWLMCLPTQGEEPLVNFNFFKDFILNFFCLKQLMQKPP
jgi:hypothetical protein